VAEERQARHKIYLYFMLRQEGWQCQFLEADLKTPLPRRLTFSDSVKIIEMAERGGALKNLAARQAIEGAIEKGRGGVFLSLTSDQYGKLKR
jgi:hypothetical protein